MKLWKFLKEQPWANLAIGGSFVILFYVIITHIGLFGQFLATVYGWIRPLVIGLIIAYVLNPLTDWIGRKLLKKVANEKVRRLASTTITVAAVFLLIVLLMVLLIPQLVDSIRTFVNNIGGYTRSLAAFLDALDGKIDGDPPVIDLLGRFESLFSSALSSLTSNVGNVGGVASSIGSNVMDWGLGCIVAIYFLADQDRLIKLAGRVLRYMLGKSRFTTLATYWEPCNEIFVRFIAFDLLDGLLVGVVNCIFMLIAGIPYSVLISVVVGVTNLAPTFGPIVGGLIGGFILLLVNPWYALWFLIFTVVLQTIDGYVLKPRLFGGSLGVPPVWILITLIIGGRMLGVPGLLLSIPFAAIFMSLSREFFPAFFKDDTEAVRTDGDSGAESPSREDRITEDDKDKGSGGNVD